MQLAAGDGAQADAGEGDVDLGQTYHSSGVAVGKGGLRLEGAEASQAVLSNLKNQVAREGGVFGRGG